jgi:hypothetical protein
MNIKILCKNIENNHTDFNADRLEELFTEFAKQYHKEQLILSGVSNRREMLIRFYIETCNKTITRQYAEDIVDNYLS